MNLRVLRIDLKRSVAPWAGAAVLVVPLAFLGLLPGPWAGEGAPWTGQWTSMALWTRYPLFFLWPLAVGLGALQGLRDPRSKMSELLTSTPRPGWQRALAQAGPTALTLVAGFLLVVCVGAVRVFVGGASYGHLGWLPISLVGALALAAGALLGMGVARALPSVLTPPALAVAALVLTSLLRQNSDGALPAAAAPHALSLLSPAVAEVRESLLTLTASVHLGQTLWLLGMAATGLALLAAAAPRTRLLALAPVLAGTGAALLLLPSTPRDTYVVDRVAAQQVCEGPVCVTKAHEARLAELAGPGKEALRLLRGALGGRAPAAVHETTVPRASLGEAERSPGFLLVDFDDPAFGAARAAGGDSARERELTRVLVGQGMAPLCRPRTGSESGTLEETVAQGIGAAWVLGDLKPLAGTMHEARFQTELARPAWEKLTALPRAEQRGRMLALHTAALSCADRPLDALTGGGAR
ncbi:hypothetical protein ACFYVL_04835 [Streptomyces sp. NPDC004111]|uniref:hypothetical protein n=1 Tax=Streptomyces sp. NPDC004111 TaxID=3364690 RepID=UPI003674F9F7